MPVGSTNFDSVTGWTAISGGKIEIWKAHNGVVASDGANFLELDYLAARDGFNQTVQTVAGQTYNLSFDTRTRLPAQSTGTQGVEVVWNGVLIETVTPASATWTTRSFTVTGTGGLDTLTIREVASQGADGRGAMLDNFTLTATSQTAFAGPAELRGSRADDEALLELDGASSLPSFDTRHHSFWRVGSTSHAELDYTWVLRHRHALNSGSNENPSDDGRHHDRHAPGEGPDLALHHGEPDFATLLGAHLHFSHYAHV